MEKKTKDKTPGRRNEVEGNNTAVRQYNKAQRENARPAEKALDSAERSEIENAELVGERHH